MRVAVYARVSTRDRDQNPETQLQPLRAYCRQQDWAWEEYVDQASAADAGHRTAWQRLLEAAAKRRIDLVLVWKLDRAFRSVLDAATTLERLRAWNVGFRSFQEPWLDTTQPFGEALYYITAAYAQLERAMIAERVKAGMERARREGRRIGRPPVAADPRKARRLQEAVAAVREGRLSYRRAARQAGVALSTLQKALREARR